MSAFDAELISGRLPEKNVRLDVAKASLDIKSSKLRVFSIGDRTFLDTEDFADIWDLVTAGQRSDYYDDFRQGTTIIPRQFWFVEVVTSPRVGINPRTPTIKTSERAVELAKPEYKDVELRGQVEGEFIFQTATGSELLPFGHLQLPIVVLPIETSMETGGKYRIVNHEEARSRGFRDLAEWLSTAETTWKRKRGEKAGRLTIYQRLDYSKGITNQSSRTRLKVLYNTSGTYLVACVAKNKGREISVNGASVKSNGLVADHKTYYWDTSNDEEAHYVAAFLNAPIVDRLLKPMQSRGDFGERDIHKKVLELPIPRYRPDKRSHKQLSDLAKKCALRVEKLHPVLVSKYDSIGKIRQIIKDELNEEIEQIDGLVKAILLSRRKAQKLDRLLQSDA